MSRKNHKAFITTTMKTLVFSFVKVCLWAFVIAQIKHTEAQNFGLIYDITESVNGLLGINTSIRDFQTDVISVVHLTSSKNRTIAIFCAIESETLDAFAAQIGQVAQVAIHDISRKQILQLQISWTLDTTSEQDLSTRLNTSFEIETDTFPNIRLAIILNLHAETKCANFETDGESNETLSLTCLEMFRKLIQNVRVGIGSDYALLNCSIYTLSTLTNGTEVKLVMYNINFGETNGLTESLTLFKREVNLWNSKSKDEELDTYYVIYRPFPGRILDNEHQRLWNKYSELVATGENRHSSFILTHPKHNTKISENHKFQVIPHLNTISEYGYEDRYKWVHMLPIALEATLKGFNAFLLTRDQWLSINSAEISEIYGKHQPTAEKSPLRVIVDLSNEKSRCTLSKFECWSNNLTQTEAELLVGGKYDNKYPVRHVVLEAILFEIETNETGNYKPLIDVPFAQRMSSNITIGCSFQAESFSSINSTKCVEASAKQLMGVYMFSNGRQYLNGVRNPNIRKPINLT